VLLRPSTTDAIVLKTVLMSAGHLPPPEIGAPRSILDLGANIGIAAAHFANLFPDAHIIGVELDGASAALASENTAPWKDRCTIRHAAVWHEDGTVSFTPAPGKEWGNTVDNDAGTVQVPAISLATLAAEFGDVDFVKMDVEGSEQLVLTRNTSWPPKVRCMRIELHGAFSRADCAARLDVLGYDVRSDGLGDAYVTGVRRA
jgi:FkbM family methyltransferase